MVRIVKEEEYAARRNEILDAAQRLVYSKGYEQMSIQDILDELQISKGAFYHYFRSKQALLEGLVERMRVEAEQLLLPIQRDARMPALEKLRNIFATAARWKIAQKDFVLALLRVWYADENAVVRQKLRRSTAGWLEPILAEIILQGRQEGVLAPAYPERVGNVVISLLQDYGDAIAGLLLVGERERIDYRCVQELVAVYNDALERILGAARGSLEIIEAQTLEEWFAPPD